MDGVRVTEDTKKEKTPDEVLAIADEIWSKVKDAHIDVMNEAARDDMYDGLRKSYQDFAFSFPIVLRWMAQLDMYHSESFKKYLRMCKTPAESREKHQERQVAWPVMLYRRKYPHGNEDGVKAYRSNLLKQLQDEEDAFQKNYDEIEKEVDAEEAMAADERRARVFELLSARVDIP
jgi:transposase-like protein